MKKYILLILMLVPFAVGAKIETGLTPLQCMTANIYFEARSESIKGMEAVAHVTMNRVKSKRYPKSVCAVVFQRKQFSWTHQKSWKEINKIVSGSVRGMKKHDRIAYEKAHKIAVQSMIGLANVPGLDNSMFYHATYVKPRWASKMQRVAKIGVHIFYKG